MTDEDKQKLKPANENPWYMLATVYGEQKEGEWDWILDIGLAERNRVAWNRWISLALRPKQRAELLQNGFSEEELTPLPDEEKQKIRQAFAVRANNAGTKGLAIPELTGDIEFCEVYFKRHVHFRNLFFP